jgi:hypothetical protein
MRRLSAVGVLVVALLALGATASEAEGVKTRHCTRNADGLALGPHVARERGCR